MRRLLLLFAFAALVPHSADASEHAGHCPSGEVEEFQARDFSGGEWDSSVLAAAQRHNEGYCQAVGICTTGDPEVTDEAAHEYRIRRDAGQHIGSYTAYTRCVPQQCQPGEVKTLTSYVRPGQFGTRAHAPTGKLDGCDVVLMGDEGCGGQSFDQVYGSLPAPYRSHQNGDMYYPLAYCTTGSSDNEPTPVEPPPAPDPNDLESPYTEIEQPNSGSAVSPVNTETEPDGTVVETQTEYEWDDFGSGETLEHDYSSGAGDGTISVVEFASYDDGRIDVTRTTTTRTLPDGTVIEEVVTRTEERGATTVETTITNSGATEVVQGAQGTVITTTTTTTQTNPDGSSTTSTTTESGTDTDGDGEADCESGQDGCDGAGGGGGEGGGEGAFRGSGLGGVPTVSESWAALVEVSETPGTITHYVTTLSDSIPNGGTCPTASFTVSNNSYTIDAHCVILDAFYNDIRTLFLAFWGLVAVVVFLKI